jgi:hypothetical protein
MNGTAPDDAEIPLRGAPKEGWRWQDNELSVLFEPIIGRTASAVYCHLTGKAFGNKITYTLRGLAVEMKRSRTTIWRAIAVLEHIGLVRIRAGGGNQESECWLVDLKKLAASLGASHDRRRSSFVLPPKRIEELRGRVAVLLTAMQKKSKPGRTTEVPERADSGHCGCANLFLLDSKRDASVSPKNQQRSSEEMQTGSYLLLQNTSLQNIPSPNPPSQDSEAQKDKDSPDEDQPDEPLKSARRALTGVMNDMRAHLLDTSRPPVPHLANGAAEWDKFGLNSLALEAAAWRGKVLVLTLSAHDPAAARSGLERYRKKWDAALRKWYECEVDVTVQETQ